MGVIQADRLIAASGSWEALWKHLTATGKDAVDAKTKGDVFERPTQLYLLTLAEHRTILSDVWRANDELPNHVRKRLGLPLQDVGIDLISRTVSGHYWTIQCKFRTDQASPLTYTELSTFSHLSFVTCKGIALALVVHTTSKPIRKQKLLKNTNEIGLDR
jgi:predicted helicase